MAGYHIHSYDTPAFERLVNDPTDADIQTLVKPLREHIRNVLETSAGEEEVTAELWPKKPAELAGSLRRLLTSRIWYKDFTDADAQIWERLIGLFSGKPGIKIGLDEKPEGYLYWDTAAAAEKAGAKMMAHPLFGAGGYRYKPAKSANFELNYTIFSPAQSQSLLKQLERAAKTIEKLPENQHGVRDQFFNGLLEPCRRIVQSNRTMNVHTDT